jgi:hypothetical protein
MPESPTVMSYPALPTFLGSQILTLWHQRLSHLNLVDVQGLLRMLECITLCRLEKDKPMRERTACIEGRLNHIVNWRFSVLLIEVSLALVHKDPCGPF